MLPEPVLTKLRAYTDIIFRGDTERTWENQINNLFVSDGTVLWRPYGCSFTYGQVTEMVVILSYAQRCLNEEQ